MLGDLKGSPSSELWDTMQVFAGSLSVSCDYCHVAESGPFDSDANKTNNTCHQGSPHLKARDRDVRHSGGSEVVSRSRTRISDPKWALLALRSAGLFLALTFGAQKAWAVVSTLRGGQPLAQWGLAQLIRSLGFPAPTLLSLCATFNESFTALFVACGLFTRVAAAVLAIDMLVSLGISVRLGEEPLRAALYGLIFATLAISGPGGLSLDTWLWTRGNADASGSIHGGR